MSDATFFKKPSINSEEFIFYIDLISDFLKKKILIKGLNSFIKEKNNFNILASYGLVIFQDNDNPFTLYDEKDTDKILDRLEDKWDTRETKHSLLENGIFEILAYIFRKSQESRKNYRVIIISDVPSDLSEDYHNALYDLLVKARNFYAFIDIIRVGDSKFYDDDVKLKVISSETHSGVFYCNDPKLFPNILGSLVQNKTEFTVIQPSKQNPILKEDKIFYEKLAVGLLSLDFDDKEVCDICQQELCPICELHSDQILKCYNCDVKYHACCAAHYSIKNNIGFRHLFRCVQCDTLLKLDEDFVNLIYEEEYQPEEEEIIKEELIEIDEEEVFDEEVEEQIEEIIEENQADVQEERKVRIGGYFGQEIVVKTKHNPPGSIVKAAEAMGTIREDGAEPLKSLSITSLKPPKKRLIKLCKICGATLQSVHVCPNCGARVD
ncbi:MAG: VWA domain-containing protein [Promethearchaeota archaeon]|nr:MAG: VWA domain-containing protein [Candidatus Lokiarchaeota archaeon]